MGKRVSNLTRDDIKKLHDFVTTPENGGGSASVRRKYGGVSLAAEYFGVSRQTINNWLKAHPERPSDMKEYRENLDELSSHLETVRRLVRDVKQYFEGSVVVDLMDLRMSRELLGETVEQQRERILETVLTGGKDESRVEERLRELDLQVYKAIRALSEYRRSAGL